MQQAGHHFTVPSRISTDHDINDDDADNAPSPLVAFSAKLEEMDHYYEMLLNQV